MGHPKECPCVFRLLFISAIQNMLNKSVEVRWENIRQISDFDYVDISEVERITEYAIEHGVTPLI